MIRTRQYGFLALALLWLAMPAGNEALAHRRSQPAPSAQEVSKGEGKGLTPLASQKGTAALPDVLSPEFFLSRAKEQEKTGDCGGCLQTLATFINLYPHHPERPATLLRLARLAQKDGQVAKAKEVYALTAALHPHAPAASRSRLERAALEFYEKLGEREPLAAFKDFLEKIATMSPAPGPDSIREPLQAGWLAVERQVRAQGPCPLGLVEEVMALWDLQPPGAGPPEAALFLAELCREKGLLKQAEAFLQEIKGKGSDQLRSQAELALMELAGTLPGTLQTSGPAPASPGGADQRDPARGVALTASFSEGLPGSSPGKSWTAEGGLSQLNLTARQPLGAPLDPAQVQLLEDLLRRPLPGTMKERLLRQLAQMHWSQADFSQAAKIYHALLAKAPAGDSAAFYQDRLGLTYLKSQRLESAQEVYQGMERGGDQFWQLVARTRLMDLELARLKAAPSP
ncbi:MAG: hypothetical protein A2Y80_01660 [Deltaproteobacteria bacterium RBG_13_58_19]|nr:MAG: hypothetical protein A2Y80_01660 [Deltaproteobacteria bacterium RBG_13_58_19]